MSFKKAFTLNLKLRKWKFTTIIKFKHRTDDVERENTQKTILFFSKSKRMYMEFFKMRPDLHTLRVSACVCECYVQQKQLCSYKYANEI